MPFIHNAIHNPPVNKYREVRGCIHAHCDEERPWEGFGGQMSNCLGCGTTLLRPDPEVEGYEEGDLELWEEENADRLQAIAELSEEPVDNPPWTDRALKKNAKEIRESGLPTPTDRGELGAGHYGAVYETTDPETVFKVTSDLTEIDFIRAAMKIAKDGEWPAGIVRYQAVIDFPETYRKRGTFGIWREAAFPVGLHRADAKTAYDKRNQQEFETYLQLFRRTAALARDTIQKKPKMLEYALTEKAKQWAWDVMDYDWIDPKVQGRKIYSNRMMDQPLSRFTGWQRIAISLRACEALAEMMEHNNPMSQVVGQAMAYYLDQGILLADVHGNNVGLVTRNDDYYDGQEIWVITDPGHAVFLDSPVFGSEDDDDDPFAELDSEKCATCFGTPDENNECPNSKCGFGFGRR